jgi:hypothetical protein
VRAQLTVEFLLQLLEILNAPIDLMDGIGKPFGRNQVASLTQGKLHTCLPHLCDRQ